MSRDDSRRSIPREKLDVIWVRNYLYWSDLQILPRSSTTSEQCEVSSLFCLLSSLGIWPPSFYRGSWRPVYAWFGHIRIAEVIRRIKCGDRKTKPDDVSASYLSAPQKHDSLSRPELYRGRPLWLRQPLLICLLSRFLASHLALYIYPTRSENVPSFPNDNQHAAGKCK
jgi:hypothetical protein